MKNSGENPLRFPCDCFSESDVCEEPWAEIAKKGVFKGGTKEKILNLVNGRPMTIAQLSDALGMAQPTIHRHLAELREGGLIADAEVEDRKFVVEKYYRPAFPVISRDDQDLFEEDIAGLADQIVEMFLSNKRSLREKFEGSELSEKGWLFEEFAQYALQSACRAARRSLEEENEIAPTLHQSGGRPVFWATR